MVKRKASNPTRIEEENRAQLSWNLSNDPGTSSFVHEIQTENSAEIANEMDRENDKVVKFRKRRKGKLIDETLQKHIDECDFYLRLYCERNCDTKNIVGEIKAIQIELVDVNTGDLPETIQCWLYISKIPNRSLLYYEWIDEKDTSVPTVKKVQYFFVNILSTPNSIFRALSKRKCFEMHVERGKLASQLMTLRIMLTTNGFVDSKNPQQNLLGGVRQDVQRVMQFFHGVPFRDYSKEELTTQPKNNVLFDAIVNLHGLETQCNNVNVQHQSLKPKLRPYQIDAVRWMIKRESYGINSTTNSNSEDAHCLYQEVTLSNGVIVFYNRFGGLFVKSKPLVRDELPGGILADEMGLGKTIEVLACILCHPRPLDVQIKTEVALNHSATKRRDYFECVCGTSDNGKITENIQCIECGLWQHIACVKFEKSNRKNNSYFCPHCLINQKPLPSRATLIVTPTSIIHQWVEEIQKHISSEGLKLFIYEGVQSMGFIQPSTLAHNDLVIMTYSTLRREFSYVDLPHTNSENNRRFRHPKRFMAIPTPLVAVEWWRICLDEAQMVESPTAKTAEMALRLSAINRWCITGTPIQKTVNDLYGLLLFLGVEPYCVQLWWKECLLKPYQYGDHEKLHKVIANVLWRTAKKDVLSQINIPGQEDCEHWLSFTPVEEHFYRTQHATCSNDMIEMLNRFSDDTLKLISIDRHELTKLLTPFLRLRQACCHPQIIRGQMLPIHKRTLTMEQLLESLIKTAKMDCERAHRGLVASLNGLAAISIIKEEYLQAVEKYREVLLSVNELEPILRTDKLQRLHTLHNLNELLCAGHNGIPPTLRDENLMSEAEEIKRAFIKKFRDKVLASREVLRTTSKAVKELTSKSESKNPWWIEALNWAKEKDYETDLIERIQSDLTGQSKSKILSSRMSNKFHDINGLSYVLMSRLDELQNSHFQLNCAVQGLDDEPSQDVIRDTVECHLRETKNKKAKKMVKKCTYCEVDLLFNQYESRLFSITEERYSNVEDDKNKTPKEEIEIIQDIENLVMPLRRGNWADSDLEKTLKSILAFIKTQNVDRKWIENGQNHLKLFEALKKDFRGLRGVWMQLRDQASAIDELSQATIRLSLRYDDPNTAKDKNEFGTIAPYEIDHQRSQLLSSVIIERNELQKKLEQLHYLTNLSKSDYGRKGGTNPEPCPICQHQLGEKWTVFICGHCVCMECLQVLMDNTCRFGGRRWKLKCPVCRHITKDVEISYVSTKLDEPSDKTIDVKGSHSTKIQAIVRQLLKIKKEEPCAKSIVFSTWQDVLEVLMAALRENEITCTLLNAGHNFQRNLKCFKSDSNSNVLLLLVQSGANGLNLIEATHVMLVEPILNPASELQAIGRIHRIGQTKATFIHRFIVRGTIEERMHLTSKLQNCSNSDQSTFENNSITLGNIKNLFIHDLENPK